MVQNSEIAKTLGKTDHTFLLEPVKILSPVKPLTVDETFTVKDVVDILQERDIGCILVTDSEGDLSGIFTERDLLRNVVEMYDDLSSVLITEVMTHNPKVLEMEDTIAIAVNMMSKGGFRHLPIVDKKKKAIGIISVKDLLDHIACHLMKEMFRPTGV